MAFRKKWKLLKEYQPDIIIVQEAEHKEKLEIAIVDFEYDDMFWIGDNQHKGVAVIIRNGYTLELLTEYSTAYKYIIPLKIINQDKSNQINLFAVWAMPSKENRSKSYVGQVWGAINYYKELLDQPSIWIGDFNSNVFWDKEREYNHTSVVKFLLRKNIVSLYHKQYHEEHGEETEPTFYFYKKEEKPYHLDYCFLSNTLISDNTKIEIGKYANWISNSDHMPLIVNHINFN